MSEMSDSSGGELSRPRKLWSELDLPYEVYQILEELPRGKDMKIPERRKIVRDLRKDYGLKIESIASVLSVSSKTVQRDLEALREEARDKAMSQDSLTALGEASAVFEKIRTEAFRNYSGSDSQTSRLGFLNAALKAHQGHVYMLLETGVLARAPSKQETTLTIEGDIDVRSLSINELTRRRADILRSMLKEVPYEELSQVLPRGLIDEAFEPAPESE